MNTRIAGPVPVESVRTLPTPELALLLLKNLADQGQDFATQNIFAGARMAYGEEVDKMALLDRLADAWAWLESRALIGYTHRQREGFQRLTKEGRELAADPSALRKLEAVERLAGPMHVALEGHVRTNFHLGEYETACFAAMKAVEVAVRDASGMDNSMIGVKLMRSAFQPHTQNGKPAGALADHEAEGGEQDAMAALFAGAIGAFKNPASHRTVHFDDPMEAAEIIQLADLLLRLVERARQRPAP
ncbi:TIGR02391 family protein [Streptomyces amritsarensis]|uniref:TIGR02391 family protein n=1 Tax=Streptomyces amritsarensis TaxID=681158 RepID=UPI00368F4785